MNYPLKNSKHKESRYALEMHRLCSRKPVASICGPAISLLFTNSIWQSYVILNTVRKRWVLACAMVCEVQVALCTGFVKQQAESKHCAWAERTPCQDTTIFFPPPQNKTGSALVWAVTKYSSDKLSASFFFHFRASIKSAFDFFFFLSGSEKKTHIHLTNIACFCFFFLLCKTASSGLESNQSFIGIFFTVI